MNPIGYLIIDPVGEYAKQILQFLDRMGLYAIGLFSHPDREKLWDWRWSNESGVTLSHRYTLAEGFDFKSLIEAMATEDLPLAGIVSWDEESILLGAKVGEALKLEWNSLAVIERCRDKAVMRHWIDSQSSLRIPQFRLVDRVEDAISFQRDHQEWPVVLKPPQGTGSQGVSFPQSMAELKEGFRDLQGILQGPVLVEEYIEGPEFVVNGMVDCHGDLQVTDLWVYEKEGTLYLQTIKLPTTDPLFGELTAYAVELVHCLGLKRTPIHAEIKVSQEGPCLIEIGARFAGGNQPKLASRLHGHNLFELAACHYLSDFKARGHELDWRRYDYFSCRIVSGVQNDSLSTIESIEGLDEVRALPSFLEIDRLRPPGANLPKTEDLDTKSWELYLFHPNPHQVELDARRARHLLRYRGV